MATKPEKEPEKEMEDDFVILETFENMNDSATSSASTIPEKQTFESLEKRSDSLGESTTNEKPNSSDSFDSLGNSNSFSSLGDSTINDMPYYESSQFIDKQLGQEQKLGVLGEGDGREKGDETCGEKIGSATNESGMGAIECEVKGEGVSVGEDAEEEEDDLCSEKGGSRIESGKGGESEGEGYGEGSSRHGVQGGSVIQSSKVAEDNGEGEKVGGGIGIGRKEGMDRSECNIDRSWMYVEDEGVMDKGEGTGVAFVGGGKQKQWVITILPGGTVIELDEGEMNKYDEGEDGVKGVDTKLVGGGKQKKGGMDLVDKLMEDTNVDEDEMKAEDKVETNVDDTKASHVEDILSDGQTDICKEHPSAANEIPVDASTQFQEENVFAALADRTSQVGESSESSLSLHDALGDTGLVNVEDLVADENSAHSARHKVAGFAFPNEPDPMLTNPVAEQGPSMLPGQAPQDGQHEPANEDHNQPDECTYNASSFDHSQLNQEQQEAPMLLNPALQDPSGLPEQAPQSGEQDSGNDHHNQPGEGTYNTSGFDHSQPNQGVEDAPLLPNQTEQDPPGLPQEAQETGGQELANKHLNPPVPDELSPQRPPQRNEPIIHNRQDAPVLPNQAPQDPPGLPRQAQQAEEHEPPNQPHNQPPDERPPESSWRILLPILVALFAIVVVYKYPHISTVLWPTKVPLPKPIIEISTKTHVPPSAASLQLVAKCKAYNTSYSIQHCQWRQIHPLATTSENTVLPGGTKDCPPTSGSTHDVDAILHSLKVPTDLGTYTFELACSHEAGNPATKRVEIWVNELIPPIMSVVNPKLTVSTSTGIAKLEVSCRAVQGKIVERKWEYIDGPPELVLITPTDDGVVQLTNPGVYKFKYRCTDSFGGTALSSTITVHAKPPYVLGIDLGTSTTCIAIIKEDGTRQDIGIYEDDSDVDPCIPSIVAFGHNGEMLIGEKALRQAVVNPEATIYEVKRLMGRSYYDDPDHKFAYRVRPTLKSHSLKGVRAAVEIPCGKFRKKLVQPELISALILRHVANHAQRYLKVAVKDVVISVPAQFDDAQRKATMDAGLIAGLNPIKIVNEPTVAAFAANSLTEKLLAASDEEDNAEVEKQRHTVWAVVADIGGGTTDYALMQIQGSYYKVITTDGDKTLGGRDIDIRLTEVMTKILADKYLGLDLTNTMFQQKLRMECENAKIVLSEKQQYSLTVEYVDQDEQTEKLPLEYLLTRVEFESYVSGILEAMIKPLDSLLERAERLDRRNIEDLYLVGGTSYIPVLKQLLSSYFFNVKNILHKDPVQLVSRGAGAFGAALTGLIQVRKMPRIDAVPLPISIAVDMDDMHVIFERNRLYPCIEKRVLTTYTNNQNAIVIKVYEGEGRTADECHFLGEFELSGIPPLPKNVPKIQATFKIDTNGILSVKASYGDMAKGMKLDVYSKSGGMIDKTREKMRLVLGKLMGVRSKGQHKCEVLEDATSMSVIPVKPRKSNVLKLSVDSEYDSVKMIDSTDPNATIPAIGMVAVKGLVTDYDSVTKETNLDIVLVVDLSGSMAGVPILTMKNVILHLIDRLKENHRLGIVTYATNVHRNLELVGCTPRNKEKARDIVNEFWTSGSTNLYGGLLTGLQMAYHGGRRSRVLLFTDGHANDGLWINNGDIIREIVRETTALGSVTQAQVTLSTFGYLGEHDEFLLQQLATNVGGGTYNFLNENTALGSAFGKVLGDAIHTIAEKIQLTITPLDDVQIVEAITNFKSKQESEKLSFEIPSTADQQSRHILLRLAVPPTREQAVHAGLYRVELAYTNTLTEREEGSEEYLYVARTEELDLGTRSHEVDEQLNRVFVARQIELALEALKTDNREKSVKFLKEAYVKVQHSDSKGHTLSVCLREDLEQLMQEVGQGDLNTAKKLLQDSLTSHWQEKGGRSSCYVTRKEDKMISIFTS